MTTWRRKYPRKARFPGVCTICDEPFEAGGEIAYAPTRDPDHWRCYVSAHDIRRGPHEFMRTENVIGAPVRVGLSDRARKDLESLKRAHSSENLDAAQ